MIQPIVRLLDRLGTHVTDPVIAFSAGEKDGRPVLVVRVAGFVGEQVGDVVAAIPLGEIEMHPSQPSLNGQVIQMIAGMCGSLATRADAARAAQGEAQPAPETSPIIVP
jgi:hypothetical protein